ncbi:MAG: T9SS type A sorting domain-containing protein [Ignavibacterium sp.]|nr:T9SS type A sorting domain-containing protein [Ignavibacterium sp.]
MLAYIHCWTNDIDKNGKPEFWVLGEAFYNGVGITRITIFETNGDNSYEQVGRVDLIGVFSFYAGTMQAVDIDNDGTEEIAICIDDNFLILKFNGNKDHQSYKLDYIKQAEQYPNGEFIVYYGATLNDLLNDGQFEILISRVHIIEQTANNLGKYETRIYQPDSTTSINEKTIIPIKNNLYQNYPNPFNPVTSIQYAIGSKQFVSLKIFNALGEEAASLVNEEKSAGFYKIDFNASHLSSGIYYYKIIAGDFVQTRKMILIK